MSNDPNTIVQNSQILLRDDSEANLPGAPVSTSPLSFSAGLLAGEIVFTKDSGRMFVGHSPSAGQANFNRISFPYQNVEVLTELSTAKFNSMTASALADTAVDSFYTTVLLPASTATDVAITVDGDSVPYQFVAPNALAAFVEYSVFDNNGRPVRIGRFYVMNSTDAAVPTYLDSGTNMDGATGTFVITAAEEGPVNGRYVVLRYTYSGSSKFTLNFRVTHTTASAIS